MMFLFFMFFSQPHMCICHVFMELRDESIFLFNVIKSHVGVLLVYSKHTLNL